MIKKSFNSCDAKTKHRLSPHYQLYNIIVKLST